MSKPIQQRTARLQQRAQTAPSAPGSSAVPYVHPSLVGHADDEYDEEVLEIISSSRSRSKRPDWWKALSPEQKRALAAERRVARAAELKELREKQEKIRLGEIAKTQNRHKTDIERFVKTGNRAPTPVSNPSLQRKIINLLVPEARQRIKPRTNTAVAKALDAHSPKRPMSFGGDLFSGYNIVGPEPWLEIIENLENRSGREWIGEDLHSKDPFPTERLFDDPLDTQNHESHAGLLLHHQFRIFKRKLKLCLALRLQPK
jgi:hypothetical protein